MIHYMVCLGVWIRFGDTLYGMSGYADKVWRYRVNCMVCVDVWIRFGDTL